MNWFYADGDAQVGPVTQEEFNALVAAGKITRSTKVWHEGLPDWQDYGDYATAGIAPVSSSPETVGTRAIPIAGPVHRCADCGNTFAETDMIAFENAWVCAGCKPVFVQKLKEGVLPGVIMRYGGFWIRVCAKIIDTIILEITGYIIGLVIGLTLKAAGAPKLVGVAALVTGMLYGIAYMVYFNGKYGATPGKMVLKLKIVRPNGEPITYMRALGRYFAESLNAFTLGIGYMMAGWDVEKRALHDRVCDTRVIYLQP